MSIPILNNGQKQEFKRVGVLENKAIPQGKSQLPKKPIRVPVSRVPWLKRKIKCPRHFILKPKEDPFIREVVPELKNVSDDAVKTYKVKKTRIKRDRWGIPIRNPNSFYQPDISAAFAIEHIYDPDNHDCKYVCRGRCMEGMGSVNLRKIRRLYGG